MSKPLQNSPIFSNSALPIENDSFSTEGTGNSQLMRAFGLSVEAFPSSDEPSVSEEEVDGKRTLESVFTEVVTKTLEDSTNENEKEPLQKAKVEIYSMIEGEGDGLDRIPAEVRFGVFGWLDGKSLRNMHLTCHQYYDWIKQDPKLYQTLLIDLAHAKMQKCASIIEDPDSKNCQLLKIAKAQALTQPEEANALAMHVVGCINPASPKIADIVTELAKIKPEEALRSLDFIQEKDKSRVFGAIATELANTDLDQAIKFVNGLSSPDYKEIILHRILDEQVHKNPDRTVSIAQRICHAITGLNPGAIMDTLGKLAKQKALTNLDEAIQIADLLQDPIRCPQMHQDVRFELLTLSNLPQAIESVDRFPRKDWAYEKVIKQLALTNPDEAIRLSGKMLPSRHKFSAYCSITKARVKANPKQAQNFIRWVIKAMSDHYLSSDVIEVIEECAIEYPEQALSVVLELNQSQKDQALSSMIKALAMKDPDFAAKIYKENAISILYYNNQSVIYLVEGKAEADPDEAIAFVGSLEYDGVGGDIVKSTGYAVIAKVQARTDLASALETVNLIRDEKIKLKTLCELISKTRSDEERNKIFLRALDFVCSQENITQIQSLIDLVTAMGLVV